MKKMLCAAVVVLFAGSLVNAEEFFGFIKKVEDGKITVEKREFGKREAGETVTLKVAENVKVSRGRSNKEDKKIAAGEALEGGLKSEAFKNLDERKISLPAMIITDGDQVREIRVIPSRKKKKDID